MPIHSCLGYQPARGTLIALILHKSLSVTQWWRWVGVDRPRYTRLEVHFIFAMSCLSSCLQSSRFFFLWSFDQVRKPFWRLLIWAPVDELMFSYISNFHQHNVILQRLCYYHYSLFPTENFFQGVVVLIVILKQQITWNIKGWGTSRIVLRFRCVAGANIKYIFSDVRFKRLVGKKCVLYSTWRSIFLSFVLQTDRNIITHSLCLKVDRGLLPATTQFPTFILCSW